MKRSLTFFLSIAVGLLMAGQAECQTIEIGLAWAGPSEMAERVTQGFDQGIAELAPEIKVDYRKGLGSMEALAEVAAEWSRTKKGMVLLRSNAAEWLGQNPPAIPTFIGACNHPGQLGVVKNLTAPEGKITGVTYFLPADAQFDIYTAILPHLKSILLLVEKGHPGAIIDQSETQAACRKRNIEYHEALCGSLDEAIAAVKEYDGKASAIIFGNQALLLDQAQTIIAAAPKTPFLSYDSRPVKSGALGGFVANDIKLGYLLAQSVIEALKKNTPIKSIPIKMDAKPAFFVNVAAAQKLGVNIPFDILEMANIIE